MTFIPIPHGARVDIIQTFMGIQTVVNRLHYVKPDFTFSDQQWLAVQIAATWQDDLGPYVADDLVLTAIRVTDMRSDDGPVYTLAPSGIAGQKLEDPLPISAALVVTLRTSNRGRSARGRMYVAGFTEDIWDGDEFNTATAAGVLDYVHRLRDDMYPGGWGMVVASFQSNGQPRQQAQVLSVSTIEIRSRLPGSQRRRTGRQ